MKIATVSFQLSGKEMKLSGGKRVNYIVSLAEDNKPDLLACAGWSLDSLEDLDALIEKSKNIKQTTFLVEVHHDSDGHVDGHVMYAVNGGQSSRLGLQFFATSGELNYSQGNERLGALEKSVESRAFKIGNKTAFALCCGELNVLRGRDNVICRSSIINSSLCSVDIIVNPSHDRMGNGGTLKAKRKYLSCLGERNPKISVSISNWNVCKPYGLKGKTMKQTQDSDTLHTVYQNGERIESTKVFRKLEQYECRIFELEG